MRTKEEILDTMKEKMRRIFQADEDAGHLNKERTSIVSPQGHLAEFLMPAAEAMIDIRDMLAGLIGGEDVKIIRAFIVGQLQLQKTDADWRATIVSKIIAEIRAAGESASRKPYDGRSGKLFDFTQGEKDDAERSEGSPHGDGRTDQDPDEAGPGA